MFNFVNNSFVINIIGADLVEFLHLVDKPVVLGMKFFERMFCGEFVAGKILLLSLELIQEVFLLFHCLYLAFLEFIKCILLFSNLEVERDEFSLVGGLDSLEFLVELGLDESFLEL